VCIVQVPSKKGTPSWLPPTSGRRSRWPARSASTATTSRGRTGATTRTASRSRSTARTAAATARTARPASSASGRGSTAPCAFARGRLPSSAPRNPLAPHPDGNGPPAHRTGAGRTRDGQRTGHAPPRRASSWHPERSRPTWPFLRVPLAAAHRAQLCPSRPAQPACSDPQQPQPLRSRPKAGFERARNLIAERAPRRAGAMQRSLALPAKEGALRPTRRATQ
jgi:hypothetical protein